jgi:Putative polyhydroxyalkanoic acid system protein (PHA_gran_rgn)
MSLVSLSIQHGRTKEEARIRLETAVREVTTRFGSMLRRVEWAADRDRVRLEGVGFSLEMWVDEQAVHLTGDIPVLGRLFGSQVASQLKAIVERAFQKRLPP